MFSGYRGILRTKIIHRLERAICGFVKFGALYSDVRYQLAGLTKQVLVITNANMHPLVVHGGIRYSRYCAKRSLSVVLSRLGWGQGLDKTQRNNLCSEFLISYPQS